jgi:hypothetical protein
MKLDVWDYRINNATFLITSNSQLVPSQFHGGDKV